MTMHEAEDRNRVMKALLILPLVVTVLALAGCNTVKGFGEDISGTASWTQEKMTGSGSSRSSDSDYVQNPPQFPKSSN
jgi:predicted small secreted protein